MDSPDRLRFTSPPNQAAQIAPGTVPDRVEQPSDLEPEPDQAISSSAMGNIVVHFTLEPDGAVLGVNLSGAEFLGYDPAQLVSTSLLDWVHPQDRERLWAELSLMSQVPGHRVIEDIFLLKQDGSKVATHITAQMLQGKEQILLLNCAVIAAQQRRVYKEQLIAKIARHTRRSLSLPQMLSAAVAEVREFLQTDRVIVYRFESDGSGIVMVESVGSGWSCLLGNSIYDSCFTEVFARTDRPASPTAIANIYEAGLAPCYIAMLAEFQAQATLSVPILQGNQLWGLLIAHHCQEPREWLPLESELFQELSEQISAPIQQLELYQQLQRENADLTRQVQKSAAQLKLALEFEATLQRITNRVRDSLDEDQILQNAVQELANAAGASNCNAAIYDLKHRISTVRYEYTTSLAPIQGRMVLMDNFPEGYNQLLQGQYFQFCSLVPNPNRGRVAMLVCPIMDDQVVLGDLWLISQEYRAFNERDIRLVQQVANHCAIAIRQARLYQASQAQVKELEKLNQLKDDFLSTVSHELRTPMSNIKLATQMLEINLQRMNLLNQGTTSLTRYFQILRDECKREINLINDLLDLSRLETGNIPLVLSDLQLADWMTQLVAPFMERARSQQQSLQLHIPPNAPTLTTDASRLERILGELLNNACKYTPRQETITLSAIAEGDRIQFCVSNSGVEISAIELSRVFDKFYRIPNNDPWKHGGTGLGLALVKHLADSLGGRIHVTSQASITCFTVEIPVTATPTMD